MNKRVVAVDCDDVLMPFMEGFLEYNHNIIGGRHVKYDDIIQFDIENIPGINIARNDLRNLFLAYANSDHLSKSNPIHYSKELLEMLTANGCEIHVITHRDGEITKNSTCDWIFRHYQGNVKDVHFANRNGKTLPKSDIMKSLGASIIIDDSPNVCIDVLGNLPGSSVIMPIRPWNKSVVKRPNIFKVNCLSKINLADILYK